MAGDSAAKMQFKVVYIILNSILYDMREPITQEYDYGCGLACFAFVNNCTYKEALTLIGRETSVKHGWKPSDLVDELSKSGFNYKNNYVRNKIGNDFSKNTIVLLERSTDYPVGHYLVKYKDGWMDPWINLPTSSNITDARSGFRSELPGKPLYALILQE
jgi:hypothetical protein